MQTTPELLRLIHNLIRIGTVYEVDPGQPPPGYKPPRVRVETGDIITGWLHWRESRVGKTRTWNPPTPGEQVLLFAPGGVLEGAIVMPGIYQKALPPPVNNLGLTHMVMPDGAVIEYDHEAHHLRAITPGSAEVTTRGKTVINAEGGLVINADTRLNGTLDIQGARVTHNGKNIGDDHRHTGVMSGSSLTQGPV